MEIKNDNNGRLKRLADELDAGSANERVFDPRKIQAFPAHKPGCSMTYELRAYYLLTRVGPVGWGGNPKNAKQTGEVLIRCVGCNGRLIQNSFGGKI